jgi:hypothetical protein
MIEMFVGRNTGTASTPTISAAYLNGIFARAKPAVKEMIICRNKMPNVKNKVFANMRGVMTERASA